MFAEILYSISPAESCRGLASTWRAPMDNTTNSVVQNTSGVSLGGSRVILDWCQFHLENVDKSWVFIHRCLSDFVPQERSTVPGFTQSAIVLSSGRVAWCENMEDKRIFVRLPATALSLLKGDVLSLLSAVVATGGTFSRLDFAIDSDDGLLDLQEILRKLDFGEVQTRWRKLHEEKGDRNIGGGGYSNGCTIKVGRRSSESFLRIYDKTAEQVSKLRREQGDEADLSQIPENWVRVELESKHRKAHALGLAVLEAFRLHKSPAQVITQHLLSLIDFKVPGPDQNLSRWLTCGWWEKFLEFASKVGVQLPQVPYTIARLQEWIKHIAPALAVMMSVDVNWLLGEITDGTARFRSKHKNLLVQAGVALPEYIPA